MFGGTAASRLIAIDYNNLEKIDQIDIGKNRKNEIWALCVNNDDTIVFCGCNKKIFVIDTESLETLHKIDKYNTAMVKSIAYSPVEDILVTGSHDK